MVRRWAEDARLLRSVVDSLEGRVYILADDGTILGTNLGWQGFHEAMQITTDRTELGENFLTVISQSSIPVAKDLVAILRDVIERGIEDQAMKFHPPGDPERWCVMRVHPIRDHDRGRAMATFIDITQGMRTQDELHKITAEAQGLASAFADEKSLLTDVLAAIPHFVYWKDHDLRYVGVNQAFLTMRHLNDDSCVLGRVETEIGLDDALSALLCNIEPRVLHDGQRAEGQQVSLTGTDGTERRILFSVLPHISGQHAGDEQIIGVIGVGADITHVTTLERQLAQANRMEAIGQLAAGVAHEINTPVQYVSDNTRFLAEAFDDLCTLLGTIASTVTNVSAVDQDAWAELLQQAVAAVDLEFLTSEIPEAIAQSQEGLNRVGQIVRAMKDFAHPGHGLTLADINRAVQTTVDVSRNEWKYVAHLETDLDPDVGLVSCYETELKQVILNLIVNSAQAIQELQERTKDLDLRKISITTRREPGAVRIVVADEGPGTSEEIRRRIFDPFFTTKEVGRGTGQGLSIAYVTIVQKHGGTIDVVSSPGAGAEFTIVIPAEPPDIPAAGSEGASNEASPVP
jgi:two-component system, NtrC family, sensor kinase